MIVCLLTSTLSVLPAEELPEYEPHPEDLELDNEPTLFEQVSDLGRVGLDLQ